MTEAEVQSVWAMEESQANLIPIADRNYGMAHMHYVHRCELAFSSLLTKLYDRVLDTAHALDAEYWGAIRHESHCCRPEVELIDYDVERLGRAGTFGDHRDSESIVTVVVMLSPPEACSQAFEHRCTEN